MASSGFVFENTVSMLPTFLIEFFLNNKYCIRVCSPGATRHPLFSPQAGRPSLTCPTLCTSRSGDASPRHCVQLLRQYDVRRDRVRGLLEQRAQPASASTSIYISVKIGAPVPSYSQKPLVASRQPYLWKNPRLDGNSPSRL